MDKTLANLVKRKNQLEEGIIPFVEPGSVAEDLAFNELFFVMKQIGVVAKNGR